MTTDLEHALNILDHLGNVSDLSSGQGVSLSFFGTTDDGRGYYLRKSGKEALTNLMESWWQNSTWHSKTTFKEYYEATGHEILKRMLDIDKEKLDKAALNDIKSRADEILRERHSTVTYYEGCHIIPYHACPFDIGPIHFVHASDLYGYLGDGNDPLSAKESFANSLHEHNVQWIASVTVPGVLAGKGEEISSIAIDLALTSIQLLCSPDQARGMRRFKALNAPHRIVSLRSYDGMWGPSHTNNSPGISYTGGFFTKHLQDKSHIFSSYGNRISAFCLQSSEKLNEAWCDSAYWFHEGIDEPIDTIAVAKLETSLEVLMSAESTSGSKVKILKALKLFSDKEDDDFISANSEITIRELSVKLVSDRSRVLHGTLSTLKHDARFSRAAITQITQILLTEVSLRLDEFKASPNYEDDHDKFLDWLVSRHQQIKSARKLTPPPGQ